jgi:hypothetical protein
MAGLYENLGGVKVPYADPVGQSSSSVWSNIGGAIGGFFNKGVEAYNSWAPYWGANTANALVTGAFSALGTLSGIKTSSKIYDLYQQQEKAYITAASEKARRIQLKGDIELRNLEYKHKVAQGSNELAVAAAGGNLSGSFLDTLVQNHKYNVMDERTSSIQTLWDKEDAVRAGYLQAIGVAGQAMTYANKQKASALAGLTSFVKNVSTSLLADKRQMNEHLAHTEELAKIGEHLFNMVNIKYGNASTKATGSVITNLVEEKETLIDPEYRLAPMVMWPDIPYSETEDNGGLILDSNASPSILKFNA